jgi:predicted TPR repeat methyltransferase
VPPIAAKHLPPLPPMKQGFLVPLLRVFAQWSPKVVQRHYVLGQSFFAKEAYWEAENRWTWVIGLQPTHVGALVGLAEIWLMRGHTRGASQLLLRALALQPKHAEARFLLALAIGCQQPPDLLPLTTPPRLLARRYAGLAQYYTGLKLVADGYMAAAEISARLLQTLQPVNGQWRVLDLGCGSGLVGDMLWRSQPYIEGVDAQAAMLKEARKLLRLTERQRARLQEVETLIENGVDVVMPPELRKPRHVYQALWQEDIRDFLLRPRSASFHAIVACEVFQDIGGLAPVFDGAARNLLPGGMLACTTDLGVEHGYHAQGVAVKFAHSEAYLNEQAERCGLELVSHAIAPRDLSDQVRYSFFRKPVA